MGTTEGRWHEVEWSAREHEVIELIGRGRTNGEIAEALGISFHTAKWHVSEVISKLGVDSREEVADYWRAQRGIGAQWRRFGRALAMAPLIKLGLGGTAAAGLAAGVMIVGSWAPGGGTARPSLAQEEVPGAPADWTPVPTATPSPDGYVERPEGCPRSSPDGQIGLLCDWRLYPHVVAQAQGDGCDLSGARFEDMRLDSIDLRGCTLTGMYLSGMLLSADLSYADVSGAVFERGGERSAYSGAIHGNFRGADLRGVTFRGVLIHGTDFTDANLEGAIFEDAGLGDVLWRDTTCPDGSNSDDHGGTCLGTFEAREDLYDTACPPDPDDHYHRGSMCHRSRYPELAETPGGPCDLSGADLREVSLVRADLRGCDLSGADLTGAKLNGAWLDGATLAGATLFQTRLQGAEMTGVDLRGADLRDAWLHYANLRDVDATGALMNRAEPSVPGWMNSTCPDGSNSDEEDGDRQTCLENDG